MKNHTPTAGRSPIRRDLLLVAEMVEPGSRVLDVGSGDGVLLDYLVEQKKVDGRGIEIRQGRVSRCVARGLSVVQGDADTDLRDYPTGAFDYAILSQTLQAMRNPRETLLELLRIGRSAIVSFTNFGYWQLRGQLLVTGRMPTTELLPDPWYETQNIHLCTVRDFVALCEAEGIGIEKGLFLDRTGKASAFASPGWTANLFGEQAIFLLHRR